MCHFQSEQGLLGGIYICKGMEKEFTTKKFNGGTGWGEGISACGDLLLKRVESQGYFPCL
jgi:hypothetical protein